MKFINIYLAILFSKINRNSNNVSRKVEGMMSNFKIAKTKREKKFGIPTVKTYPRDSDEYFRSGDSQLASKTFGFSEKEVIVINEPGDSHYEIQSTNKDNQLKPNETISRQDTLGSNKYHYTSYQKDNLFEELNHDYDRYDHLLRSSEGFSDYTRSSKNTPNNRSTKGTNTQRPKMRNESVATIKPPTRHFGTDTALEFKRAAFRDHLRQSRGFTDHHHKELGDPLSFVRARWSKNSGSVKTIGPNGLERLDDRFEVFKIPKFVVPPRYVDNFLYNRHSSEEFADFERKILEDDENSERHRPSSINSDQTTTGGFPSQIFRKRNENNHNEAIDEDDSVWGCNNSNLHPRYNGSGMVNNNAGNPRPEGGNIGCLTVDDLKAKLEDCNEDAKKRENVHESSIYPYDFCRIGGGKNQANSGRNRYGVGGDLMDLDGAGGKSKDKGGKNKNGLPNMPPGTMMMCMPCLPPPPPPQTCRPCCCCNGGGGGNQGQNQVNRPRKKKRRNKGGTVGCLTVDDLRAKLEDCQAEVQMKEGIYESSVFPYDYCSRDNKYGERPKYV